MSVVNGIKIVWVQCSTMEVSKRKIWKRLAEDNLIYHWPIKNSRLTEVMNKRDYNEYFGIILIFCSNSFSDESTFQILVDKSAFVRRRPAEQLHSDCFVERVGHLVSVVVKRYCHNWKDGSPVMETSFLCMTRHRALKQEVLLGKILLSYPYQGIHPTWTKQLTANAINHQAVDDWNSR